MLIFLRAARLATCLLKVSLVCAVLPEKSFEKDALSQVRKYSRDHGWSHAGKENMMRREHIQRRPIKDTLQDNEEQDCKSTCGANGEPKEVECSYFSCMACDFCQACFDRQFPEGGYEDCTAAHREDREFCDHPESASFAKMICPRTCGFCKDTTHVLLDAKEEVATFNIVPTGSKQFSLVVDAAISELQSKIVICEVQLDSVEMENIAPLAAVSFLVQPTSGDVGWLTDNGVWNAETDPATVCVIWDAIHLGKRLVEFTLTKPNYIVAARIYSTRRSNFGQDCYIEARAPADIQDWRRVLSTDVDKGLTVEYDAPANALVPAGGNPACQTCMQKVGFTMPPTGVDLEKWLAGNVSKANASAAKKSLKQPPGPPGPPGKDGHKPEDPILSPGILLAANVIFSSFFSLGCYMQFKAKMKQKQKAKTLEEAGANEEYAKGDGMTEPGDGVTDDGRL